MYRWLLVIAACMACPTSPPTIRRALPSERPAADRPRDAASVVADADAFVSNDPASDAGAMRDAREDFTPEPTVSDDEAAQVLGGPVAEAACVGDSVEPGGSVPCRLRRLFAADAEATELALSLFRGTGDVAGLGNDERFEGGYRGMIHLKPELPLHAHRRHLAWVLAATRAFDSFFARMYAGLPPPAYRWRALTIRFVRSEGRSTPSAFALRWSVTYNLAGSLLTGPQGVEDTLFHEVFHMNDADHGDASRRDLAADYDAIVRRCGTDPTCLAPYAPTGTRVRGGTYYAFQPGNGESVREYAAELALRWYAEQREMLRSGRLARKAFKCGPPENRRSWSTLVRDFFAGSDRVPACP